MAENDAPSNCTPPTILEFPKILTDIPPRFDYIAIAFISCVYLFLALAILTDEYFVPAVEKLCYKLKLTYYLAAATFMAMGTSSPEFFVNVVGTFISKGDMGVGAVVGSSVFNLLAVTAATGIFSGVTLTLDWWPLTRDIIWYLISIVTMTIIVADGYIQWWEAFSLISLYFVYILDMIYDEKFQNCLRRFNKDSRTLLMYASKGNNLDQKGRLVEDPLELDHSKPYNILGYSHEQTKSDKAFWLLTWPIQFLFTVTIPNVRRKFSANMYFLSILMGTLWISALSYLLSWMITVLGFNFFIPDSVMGLTFLAAGASIPEAVSSIIVARKSYGSMSVCNAVSSNTFDIFICLGVPWFIKCLQSNNPEERYIKLHSSGFMYMCGSLLVATISLYLALIIARFTLGRTVGIACGFMYSIYLILATMTELNLFTFVNLPLCEFHPPKFYY